MGNSPTNATDPSGLLDFRLQLREPPTLDGKFGVDMKVFHILGNRPSIKAEDGAQLWQKNEVDTAYLLVNCKWKRTKSRLLDVNDIGGKNTPILTTDWVGLSLAPEDKDKEGEIIFFAQVVKKTLGLRPYSITDGKVTFPGKELPTAGPGGERPYEATDEQWKLASTMQQVDPKPLTSTFTYMYMNATLARQNLKEPQLDELRKIFKKTWGDVKFPKGTATFEYVKFSDLGEWRFPGK